MYEYGCEGINSKISHHYGNCKKTIGSLNNSSKVKGNFYHQFGMKGVGHGVAIQSNLKNFINPPSK